jgi:hypothetical protein
MHCIRWKIYSLLSVLRVSIHYVYDKFHQTNRYVNLMYECTLSLGECVLNAILHQTVTVFILISSSVFVN